MLSATDYKIYQDQLVTRRRVWRGRGEGEREGREMGRGGVELKGEENSRVRGLCHYTDPETAKLTHTNIPSTGGDDTDTHPNPHSCTYKRQPR